MRTLFNQPNVSKSDLVNYPSGRIKDNTGVGDGTGVNEATKGDFHQMLEKLMRLYAIIPNDLPDNETNGFQLIDALRGLASKNDFIYPLSTNGTILSVDIKFSQMLDNEYIVCLAAFNKAAETQIKGIGAGTFTITYSGNFKTNEYVRVIKTSGGVSIIRVADAVSLDAMVADALYLKKASQAEENTGTSDLVATTPLVNKVAFARRVNGADSATYLATTLQHGLYPKTHFDIVAAIGESPIKNVGFFGGFQVGGPEVPLVLGGDISSASNDTVTNLISIVTVTIANPMDDLNYVVKVHLQSESGNVMDEAALLSVPFRILSDNQFQLGFRQVYDYVVNLKVHLEVVQL